ncbi:MAG: erythromycin biosynthesis sensory transduction protein eryC1 [Magnetococcales bacterium]|nr:erythromycin biosynthesis sensory transduction protein eryC1 [Magnetococcales bacterium]HIJ85608.1 hypothetical protein [Magnetococcales bacterium]
MGGVFLGPLSPEDKQPIAQENLTAPPGHVFVISGTMAVRLLLRAVGLQPGARVAIPALICPSVVWAIRAEKMVPAFMDIDGDGFWMLFDPVRFECSSLNAILLPHMYGLLHPQTAEVMAFAKDRGLPLLHDAAQSYGLVWQGKSLITCNQGGFVSFGAGKSTTAASGALVYGLPEAMVKKLKLEHCLRYNLQASHFLAERMGIPKPWRWYHRHPPSGARASRLQVRAANLVLRRFADIETHRRMHWHHLDAILKGDVFGLSKNRVSAYKYVVHRPSHSWSPPPELAAVPWRRVEKYVASPDLPHYDTWMGYLYEFSTERSLEFFSEHLKNGQERGKR